jgi:serine/threonine protein kinase
MSEGGQPTVGEVLDGKYLIEALIGTGGMGAVYRARHLGLDAPRAIKVMLRELAQDEAYLRRFRNEALLAEGLRHPNLVALYDFSPLPDGTWYIVWEYVKGETLASLLKRGARFTPLEVARLIAQVADGLAAAHKKGILHRDISPDNLMVSGEDEASREVKVLDFGIAKAVLAGGPVRTTTGMFLGKLGYSSPEQMGLLGEDELLDARTDVFSLAVVTYEMLTRERPFRTTSPQTYLHDVLLGPEAEVRRRYLARLTDPWQAALGRALARERKARTDGMEAFKTDLLNAARSGSAAIEAAVTSGTGSLPTSTLPRPMDTAAVIKARKARARRRFIQGGLLGVAAVSVAIALLSRSAPRLEETPSASLPSEQPQTPPPPPASLEQPASTAPSLSAPPPPLGKPDTAEKDSTPRPVSREQGPPPAKPAAPPRATEVEPPRVTETPRPEVPDKEPPKEILAPQPEPPRPQTGSLHLLSKPSATILIDGRLVGSTPLQIQVDAGRHQVVLTTEDGIRWAESVQVNPGETLTLSPNLSGFGSLSVTSEVWAEVSVDGGRVEQTPVFLSRIPAGRHQIRATRSGYKEQILQVLVEEGRTTTVTLKLEKQP